MISAKSASSFSTASSCASFEMCFSARLALVGQCTNVQHTQHTHTNGVGGGIQPLHPSSSCGRRGRDTRAPTQRATTCSLDQQESQTVTSTGGALETITQVVLLIISDTR